MSHTSRQYSVVIQTRKESHNTTQAPSIMVVYSIFLSSKKRKKAESNFVWFYIPVWTNNCYSDSLQKKKPQNIYKSIKNVSHFLLLLKLLIIQYYTTTDRSIYKFDHSVFKYKSALGCLHIPRLGNPIKRNPCLNMLLHPPLDRGQGYLDMSRHA